MSTVLYCSKINLISEQLFDVYNYDYSVLLGALDILYTDISSNAFYEKKEYYFDEKDVKHESIVKYRLSISEKKDNIILGYLCKDSVIYYKKFEEETRQLMTRYVPNTEAVRFYFDVYKETILYHASHRLGYQEFNMAMTEIINQLMEENQREMKFDVALRTEGLNIKEIEAELRKIKNIEQLSFSFQPPNPDTEMLANYKKNGERFIGQLENANVTRASTVFQTKGNRGLNLDSELIKQNLEQIKGIDSVVGDSVATSKGYVKVEAVDKKGKTYTTSMIRPIKYIISRMEDFYDECKRIIINL